jgi:alpha-beta hydrolase superfamily lysophospholipase
MRVPRHLLLVLAVPVLLAAGCSARAAAPPPARTSAPTVPAFYSTPLRPGPPGQLIRSQAMRAPAGARAWRILYHSRSVNGRDVAVSGLVIAPASAPAHGERAVIAWAHGTVGLADICAPSVQPDITADIGNVPQLLARGYVIAASDYQGLGTPGPSPLLNGISEAQNVLDSARAAGQIAAAHAGDRVVVSGHSQGGHAALFAAQIAPSYAPDLHVLGAAASAPVSDVPGVLGSVATRTPFGIGFLALGVAGYDATNPGAHVNTILTPKGRAGWPLIESSCNGVFTKFWGLGISGVFSKNPLTTQPWAAGLRRESPTGIRSHIPILIMQGGQDRTVWPAFTTRLAQRLCGLGDTIEYRLYPGAEHDTVVMAATTDLLNWITARFAGQPAPTTCHRA